MPIHTLNTYADARKYFDSVKPWRKGKAQYGNLRLTPSEKETLRPVSEERRRYDYEQMYLRDDGAVCFLWCAGIAAAYTTDDLLEIYNNTATGSDQFFKSFLPSDVWFDCRHYKPACIATGGKYQRMSSKASVLVLIRDINTKHWEVHPDLDQTEPVRDYYLNRKRFNENAKEHGLFDFKQWLNAVATLGGSHDYDRSFRFGSEPKEVFALLKQGIDGWKKLRSAHDSDDNAYVAAQRAVIAVCKCVDIYTYNVVDRDKFMGSVRRGNNYRWIDKQ